MRPQNLSLDTTDDSQLFLHQISYDLAGWIEELIFVRLFVPE